MATQFAGTEAANYSPMNCPLPSADPAAIAERYRLLVETTQNVIFTLAPDGRITSLNPVFEQLTGWDRAQWVGQPFPPLLAPESQPVAANMLARVLAGERLPSFTLRILARNGSPRIAEVTAITERHNDQVVAVLGIARDVTEQKHAEQALQESEELFRSLSASTPLGVFLTDTHGQSIYSNPQCRALFATSLMESLGEGWMRRVHPDDRERVKEEWEGAVRERRTYATEFRVRLPDGDQAWIHLRCSPMMSDGGQWRGNVATVEDVTERKQGEDTLRDTNRRLEAVLAQLQATQAQVVQQERLRAVGTMASGIAHDFNNALAAILGFSELLLHRPQILDDRQKTLNYLRMMNTAAKDAGNVVNRLREFYRPREEGEVFAPLDLHWLIQQVVSLTQPKWQAQAQASGVQIQIATDLQPVPLVTGHAPELREVLTNLIFNAVDAMPHGGTITLHTRTEGDRVLLSVTDTGTGMTDDVRQRCFEPFFSSKGQRGTGLGLAMVYGIVQRHQGTIDIETAVGRGTTFLIRLPVATGAPVAATPVAPAPAHPLSILIVDDEELVSSIVADMLRSEGHSVVTAANGTEALQHFHATAFDVVLLDQAMPGMTGDQVAGMMRATKPGQPIILLTGFGTMKEKPAGVDFVLGKPVTFAQLRAALGKAVAR